MTFAHNFFKERSGQSLIEVLVGLAIGGVLIGASTFALLATLRTTSHVQNATTGQELNTALMNEVRGIAGARWEEFEGLPRGAAYHYMVTSTAGVLSLIAGDRAEMRDGILYHSGFFLNNVYRVQGNIVASTTPGATLDRALQEVTVITVWSKPGVASTSLTNTDYLVRAQNEVFRQND